MNNWIKTDTYDLAARRGKESIPNSLHIMLSPYDVPTAVRAYPQDDSIIIEFRYINIKEKCSIFEGKDDGISFKIGDKTQRIYKIFLSAAALNNSELNILVSPEPIESAIDDFISHQESLNNKTSRYLANRSIFRDYPELLQCG